MNFFDIIDYNFSYHLIIYQLKLRNRNESYEQSASSSGIRLRLLGGNKVRGTGFSHVFTSKSEVHAI